MKHIYFENGWINIIAIKLCLTNDFFCENIDSAATRTFLNVCSIQNFTQKKYIQHYIEPGTILIQLFVLVQQFNIICNFNLVSEMFCIHTATFLLKL